MEIKHDITAQKFCITLEKVEAILAYTEINNIWDIHTVIVPDAYRGQGIEDKITSHVFEEAKKKSFKIIPTCPYVRDTFLNKHPEYNDMIEEGMIRYD